MKDEILKNFLGNFCEQNSFLDIDEDEQFEKFSNYNVISKLYPREINIDDLSTGGGDDLGIDGAAIIVNGSIVTTEEEIDFLRKNNGTLDVVFALVQSKNSPRFKGEQIGNFVFGVKSLFDESPSIPENEQIKKLRKLKKKIYQHSIDFEVAPLLKLYFVTAGEWKEPAQITGKVERELSELNQKNLFSNKVEIEFYDAERLKSSYRELSRKSVKEIPFSIQISLPDVSENLNVRQSFIGCVSVKEYITLITNDDNSLSKGLFYDNVRDYQGKNKVNQEIIKTLRDDNLQTLLPLLNNGITIIAKKVDKVGTKLKLSDFQIVNGCQSSHIIFDNRNIIKDDTNIIIKIIETNDQNVINNIIRATNRQTEVKDEAFESLKPFHKDLEEYYKAKSNGYALPIYYERRSKEYIGHPQIKPFQVVTLAAQIKSYVSIILEQPQSTHRYYGEILTSNSSRLFTANNRLDLYYISALIVNRLETLFRLRKINKKLKDYKYHIAFSAYLIMTKRNKWDNAKIQSTVQAKEKILPIYLESCELIKTIEKEIKLSTEDAIRSREFTLQLKSKI
ncbi:MULTISPECIES: AIPR family protein [Klebsiella]|uniref:AIPR family protein n=1 Tax=Klebsiella TaxID=570 RepID=UPI0023A97DA9|nr:AIPR family protein [Klebsiella michiganensis]MDD9642920.1 AIPR family protein [Klebsiella michiganensis]HBW4199320.1 AIPR family protein [Klebsiella pneumoniae]HCI6325368.1 AIPR family protein [Klebsiella pneumoniae]